MTNRADVVKGVLVWEQVAASAMAKAAAFRDQLNADAVAELKEQGTAASWRLAGIGTASLPLTQEAAYISDMRALLAWVGERYPSEVEQIPQVRAAFQAALAKRLVVDGEAVVDPATGEVVPGYAVRAGGQPKSVAITAEASVKGVMRQIADQLIAGIEASLTGEPADV
jgi:hypothetical protein